MVSADGQDQAEGYYGPISENTHGQGVEEISSGDGGIHQRGGAAFNKHGWYWGAGFSGHSLDSMHFELAEQTIRAASPS